jgi:CRISPR-associated protein Csd1
MIMQALVDYYDRSDGLPAPGWERRRIPFLIEINREGRFVQLTSLRAGPKAADVAASLVPKAEVRSGVKSYEKPNLLWDHIGFVVGHAKSDASSDIALANRQLEHFRLRVSEMASAIPTNAGVRAVKLFYESNEHERVRSDLHWEECTGIAGCNVTFRLTDEIDLVIQDTEVRAFVDSKVSGGESSSESSPPAVCLVTGETDIIQRLHFPIGGVGEKPAPLAAINDGSLPAFSSFGKHQGENFPIGQRVAFKYSTALNHLLRPDSPQKLRIGDAVAVFWAQKPDPIEDTLAQILGGDDNPDAHVQQVKALYEAIRSGTYAEAHGSTAFYVLGLAPNAARIAVRFWHAAPLSDIAVRITRWFDDLKMVRGTNDPEYPSLFRLLTSVAVQNKADNIPPRLGGDLVRAIFTGSPYPATWLSAAVQRCRAEQQVNYLRAATIKAALRRAALPGLPATQPWELKDMLDLANPSPAYRLGRLFATLEKIQEEASPGLNATIRERYYGAACSSPVTVFTTLLRLKNHHLAKIASRGRVVNLERLLGEIIGGIDGFPSQLSLPDQGRFAVGYYHQRQDFFTRKDAANSVAADATETHQGGN